MEGNIEIREIMKILHPLGVDGKLEIIARLTKELKADIQTAKENRKRLLEELFGSWRDIDFNLAGNIIESRTILEKDINLD